MPLILSGNEQKRPDAATRPHAGQSAVRSFCTDFIR